MQQSPAAFTLSLVFLQALKTDCITVNQAMTCDAPLQLLCNAACAKTQNSYQAVAGNHFLLRFIKNNNNQLRM